MKKLALALATTAALGFAAPAFAAENDMSGTKAQTQAPAGQTTSPSAQDQSGSMQNKTSAQADVKGKAKSKVIARANKPKMAHRNRGVNKLVQHDRGLHRGFTQGRYYAYAKPHHKTLRHSKTMTHY
jgi:hypothetical protein